jgi:hypothetical protein
VQILILIGGLCCVGFINPVVAAVQRQRLALSIGPT